MNSFEAVRAQLQRRQRLLQGLTIASWTLLVTLGLTAIALLLGTVRIMPIVSIVWWGASNILIAALGFLLGWFRPMNVTDVLFRADRNAHCEEKLVTLHELKSGQGPQEFLPLLEKRLERVSLDISTALPIRHTERRRWLSVLALALFCVGMTSLVHPGIFVWSSFDTDRPASIRSTESVPTSLPQQEARTAELLQTPPTALAHKLPALRERLDQARAALAQNPSDVRARAMLQQLQTEISQEQGRLLHLPPAGEDQGPPPASEKPKNDSSLVENPPGDSPGAPPGDDLPRGQAALDRLIHSLRSVQGQAQDLSPEEMQRLLDQLRSGNPEAASIVQQALQTSRNDQEFSEKLEEALKNLAARHNLNQQLEQLKREAQSALSQSDAQTARPGEEDRTSSPPGESADGSLQQARDDKSVPEGTESVEGPRDENAVSKPSGGRGKAPLGPEAVKDLPDLSQLRGQAKSLSLRGASDENVQILFDIISTGLPQETDIEGYPAAIQIDYQKVETVLETLEIPSELREAVRQYFLSLAK